MSETSGTGPAEGEEGQDERIRQWARVVELSGLAAARFWERQTESAAGGEYQAIDPIAVGRAFGSLASSIWAHPESVAEAANEYWRRSAGLWHASMQRMQGGDAELPEIRPDRRFRGAKWEENALYDHLRRSYLLASDWLQNTVSSAEGLDDKERERVTFYARQFVSALSPANFVATNPEVLSETLRTGGDNLVNGLESLLKDLERGRGELRISMTDESAFRVGENLAVTPGKVVYQNELMQLIQYEPSTSAVAKRPLLFVPPWINKYYVMDMQPANSLVKWTVDQGHTLFVISWANPDESHSHLSFEDYMRLGPLAAIDAIAEATGERRINILGFCIGGILVACLLGYLAAAGRRRPVASATLLATLFEFENIGEVGVFVDEEQVQQIESHVEQKGYLDGKHLMRLFSMMRENDLIWSFVVNNYLMGRQPMPFDLLYWNADSTRLPAAMLAFYLRKFYLENGFAKPGHIVLDGEGIDLRKVKTPCYILATKEDHIAPWQSSFAGIRMLGASPRFVLAGSGHIAGVINPPAKGKYCYWTSESAEEVPEAWLEGAERHEGSWWTDWNAWLKKQAGGEVPARHPGDGALEPIEDAPGSYVRVRI